MQSKEKIRNMALPIVLVCGYWIFTYFIVRYEYAHGFLIRLADVNSTNIGTKLLFDLVVNLPIILIVAIAVTTKKLSRDELGINTHSFWLTVALGAVYLGLFFIHGDFSLGGIYKAIFYLVAVALMEELLIRGYLFSILAKACNFWVAAAISGATWGLPHAFIPSITQGSSLLLGMLSNIGGFAIAGIGFAWLFRKSKSIFVPVLVHAILDYLPLNRL